MTCLENALALAKWGYAVFPLHTPTRKGSCSCSQGLNCKHQGKHPRTQNGFKDATTDPKQIGRWWWRWPDANIGIATGEPSNLVVLDIDAALGWQTFCDLEKRFGPVP